MSEVQITSEINFETDEYLRKEPSQAFRLAPWTDPDAKIEEYRRRRQNHIVKRDDYKRRFVEFKIHIRKMHVGEHRRAPAERFPEFLAKVRN